MSKKNSRATNKVFNPEINYFDLKIVRCTTYTCVVAALLFSITSAVCSWNLLRFDFSFAGMNYLFFEVLKVPLSLLALLIPLLAIYAAAHRSEQTKESMRLTREQNTFANYFKHMEEFVKYAKEVEDDLGIQIQKRAAHAKIFPNVRDGSIRSELACTDDLINATNEIILGIEERGGSSMHKPLDQLSRSILLQFNRDFEWINAAPDQLKSVMLSADDRLAIALSQREIENLNRFLAILSGIDRLVSFDEQNESELSEHVARLASHYTLIMNKQAYALSGISGKHLIQK